MTTRIAQLAVTVLGPLTLGEHRAPSPRDLGDGDDHGDDGCSPPWGANAVDGVPAQTELDMLLAAADTALYQAKRGGRNRVEAAIEEPLSL